MTQDREGNILEDVSYHQIIEEEKKKGNEIVEENGKVYSINPNTPEGFVKIAQLRKKEIEQLRQEYDSAGGIETEIDIYKTIQRNEVGKELNKILQFPALRPIKESLERLADNSNYQMAIDMMRYEKLKKQKQDADKLGASVPYYDEELNRLEKKINLFEILFTRHLQWINHSTRR